MLALGGAGHGRPFIIHLYMGTAVVRGGFSSIIRGEVSEAWAKMHHRLWYERVK